MQRQNPTSGNTGQKRGTRFLVVLLLRRVGMGQVVLAEQVLSIVVAIRRADYAVDVLLRRLVGIGSELPKIRRPLVIELDQDHGALHAIVEGVVGLGAA